MSKHIFNRLYNDLKARNRVKQESDGNIDNIIEGLRISIDG